MHKDDPSPQQTPCAESLEALVRYLARCAAEYDYQATSQVPAGKDFSLC